MYAIFRQLKLVKPNYDQLRAGKQGEVIAFEYRVPVMAMWYVMVSLSTHDTMLGLLSWPVKADPRDMSENGWLALKGPKLLLEVKQYL